MLIVNELLSYHKPQHTPTLRFYKIHSLSISRQINGSIALILPNDFADNIHDLPIAFCIAPLNFDEIAGGIGKNLESTAFVGCHFSDG